MGVLEREGSGGEGDASGSELCVLKGADAVGRRMNARTAMPRCVCVENNSAEGKRCLLC